MAYVALRSGNNISLHSKLSAYLLTSSVYCAAFSAKLEPVGIAAFRGGVSSEQRPQEQPQANCSLQLADQFKGAAWRTRLLGHFAPSPNRDAALKLFGE